MDTDAGTRSGARRLAPADAALLALLPGAAALLVGFGAGALVNLVWIAPAALLAEALARRAEGKTHRALHEDRGSLLLAALLALSLPPACPWWIAAGGALTAVALGRRLRDGAARTLFNPAMLAYAALLLAFPREMSRWPGADGAAPHLPIGVLDAIRASLVLPGNTALDGFTMATPLEVLRQDTAHTLPELRALHAQFGNIAGRGWEWANAGFLAGGVWLLRRGNVDWRVPTGFLLGLGVPALLNDDGSSASGGPVLFHFFGGGTMLAAFFILSEPGSSPRHPRVRLLGGIIAGGLAYLMRSEGSWPDGIAFGVLAANAITPFADRLLGARTGREIEQEDAGTRLLPRHAPDALRALMLTALFSLDWQGATRAAAASPEAIASALLTELAESGYTRQNGFSVQDPVLLGLLAPRRAWRLQSASGSRAVVLPLRAHEGYGGPIDLLLAVDERDRVLAVRVTAHTESPGFADPLDAADHAWLRGLEGRGSADARWALRKEGGDIDAFTGATVTPRAVVAAIARGLQYATEHRNELLEFPHPEPMASEP